MFVPLQTRLANERLDKFALLFRQIRTLKMQPVVARLAENHVVVLLSSFLADTVGVGLVLRA